MNQINRLAQDTTIQQALLSLKEQKKELIELIIQVQQISAPTFEEEERARFVERCFSTIGLVDIQRDAINNVFARLPGSLESSKPLILTAHSDTVFSAQTDLTIRKDRHYLYGPGIGDNSTGVASLLTLAKLLKKTMLLPKSDLWFVVNAGEEGLGNLCGMRAVVERFGPEARYIVVEGGSFGQIIHKAVGVQRFRIAIKGKGGHSWGSFGQPSAIHELGSLITEISRLPVPKVPKTTYNIGVIEGGTTVNSIAASANMLLDLRSEDEAALTQLVEQVRKIVELRQQEVHQGDQYLTFEMEQVGYRPPGAISSKHVLVQFADEALNYVGCSKVSNNIGSTDANIPLSQKIPCVCVGITISGNTHRFDEYIDLRYLVPGIQQLLLLVLAAADSQM